MPLIILINLLIGASIGICGIAGFLLPIFYLSVMGYDTNLSLALSFLAFCISGLIASFIYKKEGKLNLKIAIYLSIGSFIASFLGVRINSFIDDRYMAIILYTVVLISGISTLMKKKEKDQRSPLLDNKLALIVIGFITGLICSLTGAGGPILVIPIMLKLGLSIGESIAIGLFNSIFIGIPAALGYFSKTNVDFYLITAVIIAHGIGVYIGSKNAHKINQKYLKIFISILSISIAIVKLIQIIFI